MTTSPEPVPTAIVSAEGAVPGPPDAAVLACALPVTCPSSVVVTITLPSACCTADADEDACAYELVLLLEEVKLLDLEKLPESGKGI